MHVNHFTQCIGHSKHPVNVGVTVVLIVASLECPCAAVCRSGLCLASGY